MLASTADYSILLTSFCGRGKARRTCVLYRWLAHDLRESISKNNLLEAAQHRTAPNHSIAVARLIIAWLRLLVCWLIRLLRLILLLRLVILLLRSLRRRDCTTQGTQRAAGKCPDRSALATTGDRPQACARACAQQSAADRTLGRVIRIGASGDTQATDNGRTNQKLLDHHSLVQYRRGDVTAPPTAPMPPPISAPVPILPPVAAPTNAPKPAPPKPPVTARVPGSCPHAAKAIVIAKTAIIRICTTPLCTIHTTSGLRRRYADPDHRIVNSRRPALAARKTRR